MMSVKLLRSLVLGEAIINNPCLQNRHDNDDDDDDDDDDNESHSTTTHDEYDADDDDDAHLQRRRIKPCDNTNNNNNNSNKNNKQMKKKMPLLLFIPTKELISDTFRLAAIARDIGMDFYPSHSLSHLLFSWPSPSSSLSSSYSSFSPLSPSPPPSSSSSSSSNNRPSVSSTTTSTSSTFSLWGGSIPNDAVPLPFPSLSTASSISLLRYFVSLSKGLFKLVFLEIDPSSRFNYYSNCNYNSYNYDCSSNFSLVSRLSGKPVTSMEDFSRVLAGNGWALYRSSEKNKTASSTVFMFRKQDSNRVRAKKIINGGGGECRIRELRLPTLEFKNGVPLRILQYILLMTDDVFYLASM